MTADNSTIMANNEDNLQPVRSKDEARERGRKGGIQGRQMDCTKIGGGILSFATHHTARLSKIGRVVDFCAAKMQIQERLVREVVDMLNEALGEDNPPLGMALSMTGRHMCKESRGARKAGKMTSTYLTGVFKTDATARAEFMRFVNQ